MKVYPSKIGFGLAAVLSASYLLILCIILFGEVADWWAFVLISVLYSFVFYTFFNTKYLIVNDMLIIKLGFITMKTIEIKTIVKIDESRSILSSPSSSMHRWEIIYNKFDSIIISPKDAVGFINEIKQINTSVRVSYLTKS